MRTPKRAPVLFLVCLGLGGCFLFPKEERLLEPPLKTPSKVTYEEVAVKRADIVKRLVVEAYFIAREEKSLYFVGREGHLEHIHTTMGDSVRKGDVLAELDVGDLETQIELQRLDLERAKIRAERLALVSADRFELRLAALDIQEAEVRLQELQRSAERSRITAPFAGVVAYQEPLFEGSYVEAYEPIIRLADPTRLDLVYTGDRVYDFHPGMPVEAEVDGAVYQGQVVGTPVNAPENVSPEVKKAVVFRIDEMPPKADRGTRASVSTILAQKTDVLVLPRQVILNFMNETFVNILKDGIKEEQPVELGIITATEAEIVKGLEEGDKVVR